MKKLLVLSSVFVTVGVFTLVIVSCKKTCNNMPDGDCVCTEEYAPVCGSDQKTYSNACFASCNGISSYTEGACEVK